MPSVHSLSVQQGDTLVLVGTTKGAFVLRAGAGRGDFEIGGPYLAGQSVYAIAYDGRGGRTRVLAGASHMHFGAILRASDDFGATWTDPETANVKFPEGTDTALKQIWQIVPGTSPDHLYAGVEPAALFESHDAGVTWSLVRGLFDHPHRSKWEPGGGGLCLHTVVAREGQLLVAISTGGVYRSDDGGTSFTPKNKGIKAEFLPDKDPEFGQCVHKVAAASATRLYAQNHWGIYRSDDAGDSWVAIESGVPSTFGFPLVTHPKDADTAYVIPLESDQFRCTPEAKLRVYRTRDGGASWHPLSKGLPQEGAYECVLRDGMGIGPGGLFFGTRSGRVYGSLDDGESWHALAENLPPVVSVKTAQA